MIELEFKSYEEYHTAVLNLESPLSQDVITEITTHCNREEDIYWIKYRVGGTHEYIG